MLPQHQAEAPQHRDRYAQETITVLDNGDPYIYNQEITN